MYTFNHLKKGTANLRKNVQLMNQFEQEFTAAVDSAIGYLQRYKNSKLQWLRREKEQLSVAIEDAIKEAQNCATQGTQPITYLAESLST